ncbi:MAG: LysM peptidoglycan-binding domain-containing protein [Candidatus Moraniibacteriota bacterium]
MRLVKEHRTIKILHLFRNYASFIVVVSCALLVSATNLASGRESSGFLFGYFESTDNYSNPLENKIFLNADCKTSLALAPLAEASTVPDPTLINNDNSSSDPLLMEGNSLVSENSPVLKDPEEDGGLTIYEVKEGDTIGSIAEANHITVNTILWANELDDVNSIMPGDKIFILPLSGLSYTVKKGDDIDSIAKDFKAEKGEIIAFNSLHADGEIKEGQIIIIPGGQKEIPRPTPTPSTNSIGIAQRPYEPFSTGKVLEGKAGSGHSFPYGYCTWYVAQRRYIPWSGNAGAWLYNAKSAGYATGRTPKVGAIMVTSESWWGHVAIVEAVSGDTVTVSEMNYKGFAKKSTRKLSSKSRVIKGFIYYK